MPARLTEDQVKLITDTNFGHAATLNRDGSPHVTPVWVDWDGQHLLMNSELKRVKPRNLKRDPRIAVSIADQNNPYRYVQIRGRVAEMTTDGAFEHIDKLGKKYLGQDKYPYNLPDDQRVIIRCSPKRSVAGTYKTHGSWRAPLVTDRYVTRIAETHLPSAAVRYPVPAFGRERIEACHAR